MNNADNTQYSVEFESALLFFSYRSVNDDDRNVCCRVFQLVSLHSSSNNKRTIEQHERQIHTQIRICKWSNLLMDIAHNLTHEQSHTIYQTLYILQIFIYIHTYIHINLLFLDSWFSNHPSTIRRHTNMYPIRLTRKIKKSSLPVFPLNPNSSVLPIDSESFRIPAILFSWINLCPVERNLAFAIWSHSSIT